MSLNQLQDNSREKVVVRKENIILGCNRKVQETVSYLDSNVRLDLEYGRESQAERTGLEFDLFSQQNKG